MNISNVLIGSGSGWSPQLFYFSYTCVGIFELVIPFLHAWTMKKYKTITTMFSINVLYIILQQVSAL
jgi:hypothetical protein